MATQTEPIPADVGDRYLHWLRRCPLRPIRSPGELARAIATIDALSDQEGRTEEEHDYLIVLALLIERYEEAHFPMDDGPEPTAAAID